MTPQQPLQLVDILRADFRTSLAADAANSRLQRLLGMPFRYHPARLALAVSLSLEALPPAPADLGGRPIKGETLFGQEEHELATWVGLFVERHVAGGLVKRDLQDLVAAHWARGIDLLLARFGAGGARAAFIESLTPDKLAAA